MQDGYRCSLVNVSLITQTKFTKELKLHPDTFQTHFHDS